MLETERLLLEEFSPDDAAFMLELLNTPSWLQYIGDRGVRTLDEARQYIQNGPLKSYAQFGFGPYVVRLKSSGIPIGLCGLFKRETLDDIDIGFAFLPEYASKGYGYESASAVMTYAADHLGLTRIIGLTTAVNHNSIRLLEKLGLRLEKTIMFRDDGEENLMFAIMLDGPKSA